MRLDTTAFEKAIGQLQRSLSYLNSESALKDEGIREQFRSASIQAFEFTYELAVKMIRRQLEQIVIRPIELREMNFMDLIRTAAEAGLVKNVLNFKTYREMRNITSHTYEAETAEEVISIISDFMEDINFLLNELKRRNYGKPD